MITSKTIGDEVYVWRWDRGRKVLIYKRWKSHGFGKIFDSIGHPFTAKDINNK